MILIIGIPNSGKTTYSKQYQNVVHFDDVWSRNIYDYLVNVIKENNDVCIEGVFGNCENRKKLVEQSSKENICIWLDTSLEICLEREKTGRKRSEHLVLWQHEDFEPPTFQEGWDKIIIIKDNNNVKCSYRQK